MVHIDRVLHTLILGQRQQYFSCDFYKLRLKIAVREMSSNIRSLCGACGAGFQHERQIYEWKIIAQHVQFYEDNKHIRKMLMDSSATLVFVLLLSETT